jgi:transcriptional regulator GlxA family with amidase domain
MSSIWLDPSRCSTQSIALQAGLKQVASTAGFGSVDVMRRAFVRLLGITPRRYRELAEHSIGD